MLQMMSAGGIVGTLGIFWVVIWSLNSVLVTLLLLKLIDHYAHSHKK